MGDSDSRSDLARAAGIYIPEDRLYALSARLDLPELTSGAALFADISGFTPLTETLNRALGPRRGAEELSDHLNRVFDSLIAEVDRYGGSVVSFAGDAITCWFAEELPVESPGNSAARATAAGLAMQEEMGQFAAIPIPGQQPASLTLKVAVSTGRARRFLVGDPEIQLIPVLTGETLARMAAGEHHAAKGEVVLDRQAAQLLEGQVVTREWRGDEEGASSFAVVDALTGEVAAAPWKQPADRAAEAAALRPWVLPPVYKRLQAGLGEFLTELRPSVALFLRFGGIDFDGDPAAGAKLDSYIRWVQHVATSYDGTLLVVLFGDKGSYIYVAFGAPIAHEDDTRRACRAALELRQPPDDLSFIESVQIGISAGTMLAGAYGGSTRRTYGTLGDEVNLAARLMQQAEPGQVIVSGAAQQAVAGDFEWQRLGAIRVKGKSEPIGVHALFSARERRTIHLQEPRYSLPIVGRETELALVGRKLDVAQGGIGQIVGITADAGLGKSRLVAEVLALASARGLTCYGGECQSIGTNTAYLVWRPVWQAICGLQQSSSIDEQVAALERFLARIDPKLVSRLPLLGVLLNLPIPDNDLTRAFDAKLRKASLESLLIDCLRWQVSRDPTVIVLEDCHWLDPLSEDLVETVARSLSDLPLLLVLSYRPLIGSSGRAPLRGTAALPDFSEIKLGDLAPSDVARLTALKLGQAAGGEVEVPPLLLERIVARAQGNPFYIEELLNYLQDRGFDPCDPAALEQLDLPTSLHSLILSRIDQLSESQKITLKVASIIGRLFRFHWLWGVYAALGGEDTVKADLDGLSRLDITSVDQPEPELVYLFKHIITQEVAYDSQPFAVRTALHGSLGQFIERVYRDSLDQYVDLLAFHYDRSEHFSKRREYLRRAGVIAQAAYANAAAIDYFQRLLPLVEGGELVEVRMRLGQVLELVGEWREAEECYRLAMELASELGDARAQANARRSSGWLLRKRGDYAGAHECLREAHARFAAVGDPVGMSEVLTDTGEVFRMQGLYAEARVRYEESLRLVESIDDIDRRLAAKAQALKGSGAVAALQGDNEAARVLFEESLAIQQELGNKPGIGALLNNIAIIVRRQRDEERALKLNDECLKLFRELGDKWVLGVLLSNQGCVLNDLGRYDEARSLLQESLEIGRQLGDKQRLVRALGNLADLALDSGDYGDVWTYAEEGLRRSVELGDRTAVAELIDDVCGVAAATGQHERAFRLAGFAGGLRESANAAVAPQEAARVDRMLAPALAALGATAAEALRNEGKAMAFGDAIAYALAKSL